MLGQTPFTLYGQTSRRLDLIVSTLRTKLRILLDMKSADSKFLSLFRGPQFIAQFQRNVTYQQLRQAILQASSLVKQKRSTAKVLINLPKISEPKEIKFERLTTKRVTKIPIKIKQTISNPMLTEQSPVQTRLNLNGVKKIMNMVPKSISPKQKINYDNMKLTTKLLLDSLIKKSQNPNQSQVHPNPKQSPSQPKKKEQLNEQERIQTFARIYQTQDQSEESPTESSIELQEKHQLINKQPTLYSFNSQFTMHYTYKFLPHSEYLIEDHLQSVPPVQTKSLILFQRTHSREQTPRDSQKINKIKLALIGQIPQSQKFKMQKRAIRRQSMPSIIERTNDIRLRTIPCQDRLSFDEELLIEKQKKFDKALKEGIFDDLQMLQFVPNYQSQYMLKFGTVLFRKNVQKGQVASLLYSNIEASLQVICTSKSWLVHDLVHAVSLAHMAFQIVLYKYSITNIVLTDARIPQSLFRINSWSLEIWPFLVEKALIKCFGGKKGLKQAKVDKILRAVSGCVTFSFSLTDKHAFSILKQKLQRGFIVIFVSQQQSMRLCSLEKYTSPSGNWIVYTLSWRSQKIKMKSEDILKYFQEISIFYLQKNFVRNRLVTKQDFSKRLVLELIHSQEVKEALTPAFLDFYLSTSQEFQVQLYLKLKASTYQCKLKKKCSEYVALQLQENRDYLAVVTLISNSGAPMVQWPSIPGVRFLQRNQILVSSYSRLNPQILHEWVDPEGQSSTHQYFIGKRGKLTQRWKSGSQMKSGKRRP